MGVISSTLSIYNKKGKILFSVVELNLPELKKKLMLNLNRKECQPWDYWLIQYQIL